jgi:pimeloyl-ACP methyl ester carboxylesterase
VSPWLGCEGRRSRLVDVWCAGLSLAPTAEPDLSQRLPNGKVVLYSDAGHAFLFKHYEDFAREILEFLR